VSGVALWNQYVAPKGQAGSVLISPSMCKQAAESGWLGPFQSQISRDWDITNVHINKNSAAGISLDLVRVRHWKCRRERERGMKIEE
jgi:hypothetical protein